MTDSVPAATGTSSVWERYRRYMEVPPEQVLEWTDGPTGARGWLVLNSLRGGAAGGGTRMRPGLGREEVVYLAKTMELKFAFSGPPIGGGKSGIDFDPDDPRREEVLRRWFRAIRPYLSTCYGTGGDVNVDEQRDVDPLCRALGVEHPQLGVVRGHLSPPAEALPGILERLRRGVRVPVEGVEIGLPGSGLVVSDLVTGYGVAVAAERLLHRRGRSLDGVRAVVEGFGNVGAAAVLYLARRGARIVGLLDEESAVVAPAGLSLSEVEGLLTRREQRRIPEHPLRVTGEGREAAYRTAADLFVPAAMSGSVDRARLGVLERAGVEMVICGANQPFREERLGATGIQERADACFQVVADTVASQGMARAFYYLMGEDAEITDRAVFGAVTRAMEEAVDAVLEAAEGQERGLLAAALGLALDRTGN